MDRRALLGVVFLIALLPAHARAMGKEDFDSTPLGPTNYGDWENIMPVLNHSGRVYHYWVNGNEQFFYKGNADSLNEALIDFAAIKAKSHEVVLCPGPGFIHSFDGDRKIAFNWDVHLHGGISRYLTTLDQGDKIWSPSPLLTIYVGDGILLQDIHIPKDVSVIEISELSARFREALASSDKTVRGWGAGELASLDHFNEENLAAILKLMNDKDNWVRSNAAGAIAVFGKKAQSSIPALRDALQGADDSLQQQIKKTITTIEHAEDASDVEALHTSALKAIHQFCGTLRNNRLP